LDAASLPWFLSPSSITPPLQFHLRGAGCYLLGVCVCMCVRHKDMINAQRNQETREALFHWEDNCHPQLCLSHSSLSSLKAWHVLSQVLYKVPGLGRNVTLGKISRRIVHKCLSNIEKRTLGWILLDFQALFQLIYYVN